MVFFKLPKVFRKEETLNLQVDFDSEKFGDLLDDALSKCVSIGNVVTVGSQLSRKAPC